jgi:hypothetical protein
VGLREVAAVEQVAAIVQTENLALGDTEIHHCVLAYTCYKHLGNDYLLLKKPSVFLRQTVPAKAYWRQLAFVDLKHFDKTQNHLSQVHQMSVVAQKHP